MDHSGHAVIAVEIFEHFVSRDKERFPELRDPGY
jgi:hypothetical protein